MSRRKQRKFDNEAILIQLPDDLVITSSLVHTDRTFGWLADMMLSAEQN
jgi:hypothetical protein